MNIGIIGSENTLGLVNEIIDNHAEDYRKVKLHLHTCQSIKNIECLLKENSGVWDAVILTDIIGYAHKTLSKKIIGLPMYYIPFEAEVILSTIIKQLSEDSQLKLNRMYVDAFVTSEHGFYLTKLINEPDRPLTYPRNMLEFFSEEELLENIQSSLASQDVDMVLTSVASVHKALSATHVPTILLGHSRDHLMTHFKTILKDVALSISHNNTLTVAYIELADRESNVLNVHEIEYQEVSLHKALVDFRFKYQWEMNIQKLPNGFELSFPLSKLQTEADYLDFPLIDYLKDHLSFDFYAGLGLGFLGIDTGRQSAYKAFEQAKSYGENTCFLIDMDQYVHGPVGLPPRLFYKLPGSQIEDQAKTLGIHSHNLARVLSLFSTNPEAALDSSQIAGALNITMRSVNRILTKLAQNHVLIMSEGDMDATSGKKVDRGRPKKYYKLSQSALETYASAF